MKKFYTFEPKNFRIFSKMKSFLAVALLLLMAVGNVNAQTTATLVTSASDLAVGDQIILVGERSGSYYAMSKTQKNNNRDGVAVTKTGNTISFGEDVQVIELEAGTVSNTFAMRVEYIVNSTTETGYLRGFQTTSSSGSNYLRTSSTKDGLASWQFTPDNNQFKIVAQATQSSDRTDLRFNENNGNINTLFACYKPDAETGELVSIYKVSTSCTVTRTEPVNVTLCEVKEGNDNQYQKVGKITFFTLHYDTGIYSDTIPGVGGACDTAVTVNFTEIPANYPAYDTIKAGEGYTFGTYIYTQLQESFVKTNTFTSSCGCDSIVTLYLTVLQPVMKDTVNDFVCAGKTYTYRGTDYTAAGIYSDTVKMGAGINDTIYTLNLTVRENATYAFNQTIKSGEKWYFTSKYPSIATAGEYKDTLAAANTCDSIVTVTVSVLEPVVLPADEATICEGKVYPYREKNYTEANTYYDTVKMGAGIADTIYTLNLTVNPKATYAFAHSMDEGNTFDFFGDPITESGEYSHTLTDAAANGCDSVITVTVTVIPLPDTTYEETVFICAGETYTFHTFEGDSICTETNIYKFVKEGIAQENRDSVRILNLTVIEMVHADTTITICESQLPFRFANYRYDNSLVFGLNELNPILESAGGCDSVYYNLHLYLGREYSGEVVDTTVCESEMPFHFGPAAQDTVITKAGAYDITFRSVYGCDSTVTLKLHVNPIYNETIDTAICAGNVFHVYGPAGQDSVYSTAGTHVVIFPTAVGCDSTVTLHLTVNTASEGDTTAVACGSFNWYEHTGLTTSGDYVRHISNEAGCDSTVTLHLTINQPSEGDTLATVCDSINWYGHTYTENGNYPHVIENGNAVGCDSTVTLHLTVLHSTVGDTTAAACNSFTWRGTTYNESGDYKYVIPAGNAAGCDSTITLHLTIHTPTFGDTLATVCDSFVWHGTTYTTSGDYPYLIANGNVHGCDSTVTLKLTVNHSTVGDTTATACGSFNWYEHTGLTTSGDYVRHISNAAGCDSTVTLHLTINPTYTVNDTLALCQNELPYVYTTSLGHSTTLPEETRTGEYDTTLVFNTVLGCDSNVNMHLTVTPRNECKFNIHVNAGEHGTILGDTVVNHGDTAYLVVKADPCYYIENITSVGGVYTLAPYSTIDTVRFDSVHNKNNTLTATFAKFQYAVTATVHGNGTITPSATDFDCDSNVVYTYAAATGYHIDSIKVDDVMTAYDDETHFEGTQNFNNIDRNHTIDVYYSINHYTVDVNVIGDIAGTVTPNGRDTVTFGERPVLNFSIEGCFELRTLVINGVPIDTTCTTYTLDSIKQNTTVDVVFDTTRYKILVERGGLGQGTINGNYQDVAARVACNSPINFAVVADEGSYIDTIIWDGFTLAFTDHRGEYTVGRPHVESDMTIYVAFGIDMMHVQAIAGEHGTMTPNDTTVGFGHSCSINVVADTLNGYHVATVTAGDDTWTAQGNEGSHVYTLNSVTTDTTVRATFELNKYTVAANFNATMGTVVADSAYVTHGNNMGFTIAAGDCNMIDSIFIDGASLTVTNIDTMKISVDNVITPDRAVRAVFAPKQYHMANTPTMGGTVSDSIVNCGSSYTYTITPATGYHVDTIYMDNDSVVVGPQTIVYNDIRKDHNIKVVFAINDYQVTATTDGHGTVIPDTSSVAHGGSQTFYVFPNDCYHISSITVNGTDYDLTNVTDGQKKYQRVIREEHFDNMTPSTISALGDCSHNSNTITPSSYNLTNWSNSYVYESVGKLKVGTSRYKGTINISNLNLNGESYTVAFDAKGYGSSDANVSVNNKIVNVLANSDCELSAYSVTIPGSANSVVIKSAGTPDNRFYLDNLVITVTDSVKDAKVFTVNNIIGETEVVVNFEIDTFLMTQYITGNGTVNGVADTTVKALCGDDYIYTMTAAEGHHVVSYSVNNGTPVVIDNTESYVTTATDTIKNIHENDTIRAEFAINTYTITAVEEEGEGTFEFSPLTVEYDADTMIIVKANNVHGYHIAEINTTASNIHRTYTNADRKIVDTVYFNDVRVNDTLKVKFALDLNLITVIKHGEGTVHPTDTSITFGDTVTFAIEPAPCYYISSIMVDSVEQTIDDITGTTYTFNHVTEAHSLIVTFDTYRYVMGKRVYYPSMGEVSSSDTVVCGQNYTYVIHAFEGYHIHEVNVRDTAGIWVNDTIFNNQEDDYELTIENIHFNHTAQVVFEQDYYNLHLAVNPTEGGTLVCDSTNLTHVLHGTPLTFTATANECYELTGFTINDTNYFNQLVNGVLTWNAIDSGEVLATFTMIRYEMAADYDETKGTVTTDTVNCGTNYKYIIDANVANGYHIDTVTIGSTVNTYGHNTDITDTLEIVNASSDTTIHVVFGINTYTVTPCTAEGGTVTVNPATVNHGETCEATITANAVEGYHIDTIKCGDEVVRVFGVNDSINYVYAIENITSDTTICATFSLNTYKITASVDDATSIAINPVNDTTVFFGDTVVYVVRPLDDCHYITTVVVDDTTTINHNDSTEFTHTFADIRSNHTIVANSAIYRYSVTTVAVYDSLGTVTPADTMLNCGANIDVTVTPITGYHIDSVMMNGVAQTIADSSTFATTIQDIHTNDTVIAYFGINHYTIASTSGENGTIAPEDTLVYEYGMTPSYTITPDACYYIDEVTVDGTAVELTTGDSTGGTYTFAAITTNHTIHATFAKYHYAMTAEYDNWMGTVNTEAAQECGSEYKYIIDADSTNGYHIVSYTIGGVTVNNPMVEPNDFVTDTVIINPVSQDTNLVVVFDTNTYTVEACTGVNGTLVVTGETEVNYNKNTEVKVTADYANGYHIVSITDGRGNDINLGRNIDTTYTYAVNNVTEDITVCATFALDTFKITSSVADANGTITPLGDSIVIYGDVVDYVVEPNTCYYISDVKVEGNSIWTNVTDSVSPFTYTFNTTTFAPEEVEHTISAEFQIFQYTMASNAITEGTVSSAVKNCGEDYDYEIEANYGYHIDHVVLDGVTTTYTGQQTTDIITVTNIHENHQLDVYFSINHYTVTATAGENGTIEVAGETTVEHGESLTYTITPNHCYYISEVLVDGVEVEFTDTTGGTYTLTNIVNDMTIHANFHIFEYNMNEEHTGEGTVEGGIATCGSNFVYHITAAEGWHIASMRVGDQTHNNFVGQNDDTEADFRVYNVFQDTVCYVEFEKNTYAVNFNVTGEGEVDPGNTTVTYDSTLNYTVNAAEGYHIVSITDNGTVVYSTDSRDSVTYTGDIANIREDHTVDVVFAINQYTITPTAGEHGEIVMPTAQTVNYGGNVNFTIRTNEPCYSIDSIIVDDTVTMAFTNNETLYVYTFSNVTSDHTIEAKFASRTYTVAVTSTGNGTVNPSEALDTLNCGDNATYTFTPDEGYEVVSVTVNGTNVGAQTSYTISNIDADYTIDVVFGQLTYTLSSVAYNHGTISPLGDSIVAYGSTMVYTLTPEDCYKVDELLVEGVSYLDSAAFDGETLTLENIHSDMEIQAYFQKMTYSITSSVEGQGTITAGGVYDCGTDVTFTISESDCSTLLTVMVDGQSVGAVYTYTFSNLDTNHTIVARFATNMYTVTASVNDSLAGTITATNLFECGETPTYEITANEGYHIVNVEVDGQDQGAIESYTFPALHENHTIVANFEINTYTLTAHANAGVEILPADGDSIVEFGDTVTYTFNVDSCYEITSIMVDGEEVALDTFYTFFDVAANHTLMVNAEVKTYTITATTNEGGTITPAGETTVTCNGTQSFSITASAGYYVENVLVDGDSVGAVNNYVFSGVTEDHTIEVVFASTDSLTYTITATAGANGTITPEGETTVYRGASVTYVITPNEYYTVDQVIVDGNVLPTPVRTYTFSNVTADHTIEVTFVADQTTCIAPNITYTTNITETSATFNWNDTEATSYTVRYKKTGDTTYTIVNGITGTSYDVTGLEEASEYVWSVKAVCIDSVAESNWSVAVHFTTEETIDTTDIHSVDMNAIHVYSYGNDIYVTNESNEQIKDVQVYDMSGRLIHKGMAQSNPEVINVKAANGIYIVRVVTNATVRNYKVSISQR